MATYSFTNDPSWIIRENWAAAALVRANTITPPTGASSRCTGYTGAPVCSASRAHRSGFAPSKAREHADSAMQNLFKQGDRVMHRKFGEGRVVKTTGKGAEARIQIEFTAYGVKEFSLAIAPIVKLEDEE